MMLCLHKLTPREKGSQSRTAQHVHLDKTYYDGCHRNQTINVPNYGKIMYKTVADKILKGQSTFS